MKMILLIPIAILIKVLFGKSNKKITEIKIAEDGNNRIVHPAAFNIRW
jgi:hypothetical protein